MEYEEINITKIKDGFFIGDEATSNNLDIIIKFKITRMINTAANQIINAWESIGIKYLTIKWSESSSQNLFDTKDDIANKIVKIIDDADKLGEGILIHSVRGRNRACIIVIIYLMKKYHWSLKKSLEFIKNKKCDVEIRKYFLDQLASFEERLKMNGISKFSNDWNNDGMYIDADEMIIRNTYINGIIKKNEINKIRENNYRPVTPNRNKIRWADGSRLVNVRIIKDVLFQKDFSLIASNKNKMPKKSCMKKRNNTKINTQEIKRSSSVVTTPLRISDSITNHREIENFNKTAFNSLAEAGKIKHISSSEKNLDLNKKESLYLSSKYVDRNMNRIIENDVGRETNLEKKYLVKSSEINEKGSYKNVNSYPDPYTSIKESKEAINKMESNKIQSNFKDNDLKQRYSSKDNHNYRNIEKLNSNQHISSNPSNAKKNNYIGQNTPIASQYDNISKRANSLDRKSNNPLSVSENKNIIISPKYENIINNNYNNIYIQSKDFEKIRDLNEYSYSLKPIKNKENQNDTSKEIPRKDNGYSLKDLNYNYNLNNNNKYDTNQELNKNYYIRDNIKQVNYSSSDFNFKNARYDIQDNPYRNNRNNLINSTGKLIKNSENQKTISSLCNRYNHVDKDKNTEYSDSSSSNKYLRQTNSQFINATPQYDKQYVEISNDDRMSNKYPKNTQTYAVNNYKPELVMSKLNNFNKTYNQNYSSQLRSSDTKDTKDQRKGPIKISKEYDKKPLTPDTFTYSSNINSRINQRESEIRSRVSDNAMFRPHTPQQYERDTKSVTNIHRDSSLRRINSPLVKCHINDLSSSIYLHKYRALSPAILSKSVQYTVTPTRGNLREYN